MSRRDELLAKTANIRSTADIPDAEVSEKNHVPRSGQGSFSRRQALEERIAELEKAGAQVISVAEIGPNPWQPRRVFNETEIGKLAASIAEVGLIQPVGVRRVPLRYTDGSDASVPPRYTFELVAGERRLRAHRMLGLTEIKAVILEASDAEMAIMALAENIDREDLSDYEISLAIRRVEQEFPNRTALAESMGIIRSELYRYLAFNKLPDFVLVDLEGNPKLLTRMSADAVVKALSMHGERALRILQDLWPQVKNGTLEHPRLAGMIDSVVLGGKHVTTDRDIRKLFVGNEQAGSITRDTKTFTVKIKTAALTPTKEAELRVFVEKLLMPNETMLDSPAG
jgi:ParB family transcriptional regulator, chromosome partitioning protein